MPSNVLKLLIDSLVLLHLTYALPVWDPATSKQCVMRLQCQHNWAVCIVKNLRKFDHVSAHQVKLGWLPMDSLISTWCPPTFANLECFSILIEVSEHMHNEAFKDKIRFLWLYSTYSSMVLKYKATLIIKAALIIKFKVVAMCYYPCLSDIPLFMCFTQLSLYGTAQLQSKTRVLHASFSRVILRVAWLLVSLA